MKNSLSSASLVARSTGIMGALAASVSPPPDFCPFGGAGDPR